MAGDKALFLCLACSVKYAEVVKKMPGACMGRAKCAVCGRKALGEMYYTGAKPPKLEKQPKRRR